MLWITSLLLYKTKHLYDSQDTTGTHEIQCRNCAAINLLPACENPDRPMGGQYTLAITGQKRICEKENITALAEAMLTAY